MLLHSLLQFYSELTYTSSLVFSQVFFLCFLTVEHTAAFSGGGIRVYKLGQCRDLVKG